MAGSCNIWRVCLILYIAVIVSILLFVFYTGWDRIASYIFDVADESSQQSKLIVGFMLYCLLVFVGTFWLPSPGFCMLLLGFFCGFWTGTAFGVAGELTALVLSVTLVRVFDCMRDAVEHMPKLRQVSAVLAEEDTKFLILFRFIMMPLCVKNYALGVVDRPPWRLALLSAPGACYWAGIIVYLGTKAHVAMKHLRRGESDFVWDLFSGWEILVIGVSILAAIGIAAVAWWEYRKREAGLTDPLLPHEVKRDA